MGRVRSCLWIVIGTAVVVRVLHLLEVQGDVLHQVLIGDERLFFEWGERLAREGWTSADSGDEWLFHAPGYAWFLGAIRCLHGDVTACARIAQGAMGVTTACLVACTARRLFGPSVGLVAGVGAALYAPGLFYEATLHKPALAQFTAALAGYMLVKGATASQRRRARFAVGFGLAVGLGALVQEILVVLLPLAATMAGGRVRERLRPTFLALVGFGIASLPLMVRNHAVGEPLFDRTHNMGVNLWIGCGAGADGGYRSLLPGRGWYGHERSDAVQIARSHLGRSASASDMSAWWRDRALAEMAAEPLRTATVAALKIGRALSSEEWADSRAYEAHRPRSLVLDVLGSWLNLGLLLGLAAAGVIRRRREPSALVPTVGAASLIVLGLSLFFVFGRLRLALVPFLLPLSADSAVAAWRGIRAGSLKPMLVAAGGAAYALSSLAEERGFHPVATTLTNASALYASADRGHLALELSEEAVRLAPGSGTIVLHHGALLMTVGDLEAGTRCLERAAEVDPSLGFRSYLVLAEFALARRDSGRAARALSEASYFVTKVPDELRLAAEFSMQIGATEAASIFVARADHLAER